MSEYTGGFGLTLQRNNLHCNTLRRLGSVGLLGWSLGRGDRKQNPQKPSRRFGGFRGVKVVLEGAGAHDALDCGWGVIEVALRRGRLQLGLRMLAHTFERRVR